MKHKGAAEETHTILVAGDSVGRDRTDLELRSYAGHSLCDENLHNKTYNLKDNGRPTKKSIKNSNHLKKLKKLMIIYTQID